MERHLSGLANEWQQFVFDKRGISMFACSTFLHHLSIPVTHGQPDSTSINFCSYTVRPCFSLLKGVCIDLLDHY